MKCVVTRPIQLSLSLSSQCTNYGKKGERKGKGGWRRMLKRKEERNGKKNMSAF